MRIQPHHIRTLRLFAALAADRHAVQQRVVDSLVDAELLTPAPKRRLHRVTDAGYAIIARADEKDGKHT